MKKFEAPEFELIRLMVQDVITASGDVIAPITPPGENETPDW